MPTPSELETLIRQHITVTGDGNVVGDHNTVIHQTGGDYAIKIGQLNITLSFKELQNLLQSEIRSCTKQSTSFARSRLLFHDNRKGVFVFDVVFATILSLLYNLPQWILERGMARTLDGLVRRRLEPRATDLELYPLDCGTRGIDLGEQRLLVSSAFGAYFAGLLEREHNYISLQEQIECPAVTKDRTLSGIQRIFWALQYPKGPRILIIAAEGGMGKSTLAAKVVRCMVDEQAADMILGDSAKRQQIDPVTGEVQILEPGYYDVETFYSRLADQLGLPQTLHRSALLTAIKDRLVGRRAVIIVDNLESIQKGDDLLRSLRTIVNRDVRAIITTRRVEGLRDLTVSSLIVHLNPLTGFEAIRDFLEWHIHRYVIEYPELEHLRSDLDNRKQIVWLMERTGGVPLLLQLIASDVARFSWEYLQSLPRLFGDELLAYLYETRWQELGNKGLEGEVARSILQQIVDCQYAGKKVTFKHLTQWLEVRGTEKYLQRALRLLHVRFLIINQDPQRGNFVVFPSFSEFLKNVPSE